jgi:hypothetical protein
MHDFLWIDSQLDAKPHPLELHPLAIECPFSPADACLELSSDLIDGRLKAPDHDGSAQCDR